MLWPVARRAAGPAITHWAKSYPGSNGAAPDRTDPDRPNTLMLITLSAR